MKKFTLSLAVLSLVPITGIAQSSWKLPNTVSQSITEQSGQVGWVLPNKPPYVRSASGRKTISKTDRPDVTLFANGTVVTTGFPGVKAKKPYIYRDGRTRVGDDEDYLFLDPNGVSAVLLMADDIGFAMNGSELTQPAYDKILARDVGMVFGIAIDDEEQRNLYLTATSTFGLNIVGQDENNDRVADRLYAGQDRAKWMPAQWGNDPAAGPGSVWKVDGQTGQISLFANIRHQNADSYTDNSGAALGNIAFDRFHSQLFVSDRDTGMIHRLDLDGNDLEQFDHGVTARLAAGRTEVKFDPKNRLDIEDENFDVEDPDSWAFAKEDRRVWGLTVHRGRLYYAVAAGPEVWSVGLDKDDGSFLDDARWELTVSDKHPDFEISDMVFDASGAMILAQRGTQRGDYKHEKLARTRRANVLRYSYEYPEDPDTPSVWFEAPHRYSVGFSNKENNTTGGVDVGPGFDENGDWNYRSCRASLWNTGEKLRHNDTLETSLQIGGELNVAGIQVQPTAILDPLNSPPWRSYFADYDASYPDETREGHIGDVEVLGCSGSGSGGGYDLAGDPTGGGGGNDDDTRDDDDDTGSDECKSSSDCPPPPPPPIACLDSFVRPICDKATGTYSAATIFTPLISGIDRLELTDLSGGAVTPVPADVSVDDILTFDLSSLSSGQPAQIKVCGYNSAQKATGGPYDCCKANLTLTLPDAACVKEIK